MTARTLFLIGAFLLASVLVEYVWLKFIDTPSETVAAGDIGRDSGHETDR